MTSCMLSIGVWQILEIISKSTLALLMQTKYVQVLRPIELHWLHKFISKRIDIPQNKTLSIFGINGDKLAIALNRSDYKLFYTIENVHVKYSHWNLYEDLLLENKNISLSLGFDYINHPQYLRFPYWLMATFDPDDDYKKIRSKCDEINNRKINIEQRNKFCAFICRADYFGDRVFFADEVSKVGKINYPGAFRHNDDDEVNIYGDHKLEYLHQFKFNLCPENSNNEGYVTEKIFDALNAGCIPIYWGSNNNPEPKIINQNAIFFLERNGDNINTTNEIDRINKNQKLYLDFINQPRLTNDAPALIHDYFCQLENKIKEMILLS